MLTVEIPMVNKAATKVTFRPTLSPKCPKKAEPNGLDKKAMEKVAKDSKVELVLSAPGKNNCGKTNTAALA